MGSSSATRKTNCVLSQGEEIRLGRQRTAGSAWDPRTRTCDPCHNWVPSARPQSVIVHPRIRVFSVDDHPLLREGIVMVINSQPDMIMVAQASNGTEAIERFREHKPDITLMDLMLPDMSGIDAMVAIRAEFPEARVIILTTFEAESEVQRALANGACAYMLKSVPPRVLAARIRQVDSR